MTPMHMETALATLHSAHSDAIGAPKVHLAYYSISLHTLVYSNLPSDPQCAVGGCGRTSRSKAGDPGHYSATAPPPRALYCRVAAVWGAAVWCSWYGEDPAR